MRYFVQIKHPVVLRVLCDITQSVILICNSDHFVFVFTSVGVFFSISFRIKSKLPNVLFNDYGHLVLLLPAFPSTLNCFIMTLKCLCFSDSHVISIFWTTLLSTVGWMLSLYHPTVLAHHWDLCSFLLSLSSPGPSHIHTASSVLASSEHLMVGWMNKYTVGHF